MSSCHNFMDNLAFEGIVPWKVFHFIRNRHTDVTKVVHKSHVVDCNIWCSFAHPLNGVSDVGQRSADDQNPQIGLQPMQPTQSIELILTGKCFIQAINDLVQAGLALEKP